MNNIPLVLKRPKLKNIFGGVLFTVIGLLCVFAVFLVLSADPPVTFWDKIINVSIFCSMLIVAYFMFFSLFNSVRNLLSPPTVLLDNDRLKVLGYDEMFVKNIAKTELIQKKRTLLKVKDTNENEITITQNLVSIPLKTLEYAIRIRIDQLNRI